jgi:hypothetical protein
VTWARLLTVLVLVWLATFALVAGWVLAVLFMPRMRRHRRRIVAFTQGDS